MWFWDLYGAKRFGSKPGSWFLVLGITLIVIGMGSSRWRAKSEGNWDNPAGKFRDSSLCQEQAKQRSDALDYLNSEIDLVEKRLSVFRKAQAQEDHPLFLSASMQIEKEEEVLRELVAAKRAYEITPVKRIWMVYPRFMLLILLLGHVICVFSIRMSLPIFDGFQVNKTDDWKVLLPMTLFFFSAHIGRLLYASYWIPEKSVFGWASICISATCFWLNRVDTLGSSMVVAYMFLVFWRTSGQVKIGDALVHGKGVVKVLKYVNLQQSLFMASVLALFFFAILWLGYVSNPGWSSLVVVATAGVPIGLIWFRSWFNISTARSAYWKSLYPGDDSAKSVPKDGPVADTLGMSTWEYLRNTVILVAAGWGIVKWTGLDVVLRNFLN